MLQLQIASCQSARGFLNLVRKGSSLQICFSVLVGTKDSPMLSSLEGWRKTVLRTYDRESFC